MVNRYCIMYKYNSINHTNEKTEAFYCLKNNYDKEKTKYYTSSLSDNRNHIIVFSQYFRYRRQWKQVRAGRYKRLAADSRAMPGSGIHGNTGKSPERHIQRQQ
jgi:nitrous oxide reductase